MIEDKDSEWRGPVIGPGVPTRPRAVPFSAMPAGKNVPLSRARVTGKGVEHMTWP